MIAKSNQKTAEVDKLYFETKSPITIIHMMLKKYPRDDRLTKHKVHRLFNRIRVSLITADHRRLPQTIRQTTTDHTADHYKNVYNS